MLPGKFSNGPINETLITVSVYAAAAAAATVVAVALQYNSVDYGCKFSACFNTLKRTIQFSYIVLQFYSSVSCTDYKKFDNRLSG